MDHLELEKVQWREFSQIKADLILNQLMQAMSELENN